MFLHLVSQISFKVIPQKDEDFGDTKVDQRAISVCVRPSVFGVFVLYCAKEKCEIDQGK